MNIRISAVGVSALALMGAMVAPTMADEWNKETRLEFSAPVEVPGRVLAAGKYVFKLADNESDRNFVLIFSEDANGAQKLVTTILAIPDYRIDTPDKTIVKFEERSSGSPEAIHSWFYPGDNTGWEFVYPKADHVAISSNIPTEAAPALAAAPAPDPEPAPAVSVTPEPVASVTVTEDDVALIAQNDAPELVPAPSRDSQVFADQTLPQTAGQSGLEWMLGAAMLSAGMAVALASRLKSRA